MAWRTLIVEGEKGILDLEPKGVVILLLIASLRSLAEPGIEKSSRQPS